MKIQEQTCEQCNKKFKTAKALAQHNSSKHVVETKSSENPTFLTHLKNHWSKYLISIFVVVALFGFGIYQATKPPTLTLPPTSMQGHTEARPSSNVLKTPMDISTFKHMLEHADGAEGARGGVIISYNCKNYECEEGFVEALENFATGSDYVYVAPYKNMQARLVITKLGWQKIIEDVNDVEKYV